MSTIEVNKIAPVSGGTTVQIGESGDTINIPSGATLANAGSVTGLPASAISSGVIASARLGTGTASSSTVLYGDGTFKAEPSGGFIRVGGGESGGSAVNVANVSFDNVFTTTYDTYFISLFSQCVSNNSHTQIKLRNGGSDRATNDYMWVSGQNGSVSGTSYSNGGQGNTADAYWRLNQWGGNTAYGNYHAIWIYNPLPQSTDQGHGDFPYMKCETTTYTSDGYMTNQSGACIYANGTGGDGFKFYESQGNVARYTVNIYGMVQS